MQKIFLFLSILSLEIWQEVARHQGKPVQQFSDVSLDNRRVNLPFQLSKNAPIKKSSFLQISLQSNGRN